jgi:hypothetical protein
LGLDIVDTQNLILHIVFRHPVDMGDFESVFVEQGNIEDFLQFLIIIITDIGIRALRLQKIITLFPNADRVGFDARQIFQIFNCECVH